MAGNTTNALSFNITATDDASANVPINESVLASYDSSVSELARYWALGGGVSNIQIIKSPCVQFYIKNIDAAKSVSVAWTPNGGASNNVIVLNPGDLIIIWCNPAGVTTPGVTAIALTPSAAGCLIEYFFGG